jgi:outer membrane protein insertion porin family
VRRECTLGTVLRLTTKLELLASVCLFLVVAQALPAQQPPENAQTKYIVERLDIVGNRRVETDTIRALISSQPGDPYNVEAVRRDVRSLLNTGFFDDVGSEVEDARPNGKTVIFILSEKPIVASIDYKGIKSITESDILAAFKDQKVELSVGSWFDQAKMKHALTVIRASLASRGHQSATVNPTYERIPSSNTVALAFNIDEGPKSHK